MLASGAAGASAITHVDNRAAIDGVYPILFTDDFNDLTTDQSLNGVLFDRGSYSILADRGGIQAAPFPPPPANPLVETNIDGTTYFTGLLGSDGTQAVDVITFTFNRPINAFGAQFDQFNDNGVRRNEILFDDGRLLALDVPGAPVDINDGQFFGFVTAKTFQSFTILLSPERANGDGFAMDNVVFGGFPVPAPGVLAGFLAGAFMLVMRCHRRG